MKREGVHDARKHRSRSPKYALGESAVLKALAEPVDINGNPTGGPLQDVRDLGYGVEFYLETPPHLFDPTLLPDGDAFAVLAGDNVIHAAITSIQLVDGPPEFTFWPGGVLGFVIARFLAVGELPRVQAGGLPVTVNAVIGTIGVTPLLVFRDNQGGIKDEMMNIQRYEPFETPPGTYSLGVKLDVPADVPLPQTLTFKVTAARLLAGGIQRPPLDIPSVIFVGVRSTIQEPTRFFTGRLAQDNQQATLTINSRPDPEAMIPILDLDVSANQVEDAGLTKLAPPGFAVGNRHVVLSVNLSAMASDANTTVSMNPSHLDLTVVNSETFEEYLRVFREAQGILSQANPTITSMRDAARDLLDEMNNAMPNPASPVVLMEKGKNLWNLGWQLVQGGITDDRPLYYARLQAIAAIRAYYRRNNLLSQLNTAANQFEWASRGLSSLTGTPGGRIAIVTGFDPFRLTNDPDPRRSNPSGLIALNFNDKEFTSIQSLVRIVAAIFPVRYDDFDAGMIEQALGPSYGSIIMLITFSEGPGRNFYDVERFATKKRAAVNFPDNLNRAVLMVTDAPGTGTAEYLESTLPYERVITADIATRQLKGPTSDQTPFVLDQSYLLDNGDFVLEPSSNAGPDSYVKNPAPPNLPMSEGSGGSFLSNEIFYRTASLRNPPPTSPYPSRPSLPSGHIHVPSTGTNPQTTGPRLLEGVEIALQRFMQNALQLRSSGDITFPPTVLNTTSQPVTLTVTNEGTDNVLIAAVQVAAPFAVQLPGALPLTVAPGAAISLQCTFTPNAVTAFAGNVTLRGPAPPGEALGEPLLTAALSGQGIASANTPRITGFSPTSGQVGDTVEINGENLDGTISVEIGAGSVPFTVASPALINAVVSAQAMTGLIKVTTPNGIAFSQTPFTVQGAMPPAPTGLTATVASAKQIDLQWNDVTGEDGYKIERKTSGTDWVQIATVGSNVTSKSDKSLSPGTYTYRVRAFNSAGNSPYSNEASATL